MEASSSTHHLHNPSHPSLLPSLSPSTIENTPTPIQSNLQLQMQSQPTNPALQYSSTSQQPMSMTSQGGQSQMSTDAQYSQSPALGHQSIQQPPPIQTSAAQQASGMMGPPLSSSAAGANGMMQPQAQSQMGGNNVFGVVMGQPGQGMNPGMMGQPKVYASVYSGIPVYEAMIRGISVMRRTSDSWVNATQILKVAGIPKSARTKILDKDIQTGMHEKVQGGYGKYQGTWIPFQRGQELAAQHGVTAYLSPIFDYNPSPNAVPALPMTSGETPDRPQKTPGPNVSYTPGMMPAGQVASPYGNGEAMVGIPPHPSALAYAPNVYYPPSGPGFTPTERAQIGVAMTPSKSGGVAPVQGSLQPAADINGGMGLPPSNSDVYIDQYGQPHPTYQAQSNGETNGHLPPPPKRQRSDQGEENQDVKPETMDVDEDDESVDGYRETEPLPASMRLSTRPTRPKPSNASARNRAKVLNLFTAQDPVDLRAIFSITDNAPPADLDIDMVIDNQGHTALHWACAVGRNHLVQQLIELGADIHRGNYAGETPLIRSVLTTNHAEAGTFHQLLSYLSSSIRTLDHAHRTVVHHIALIAGVRGRAASARTYMARVLEWVARESMSPSDMSSIGVGLRSLIDVQDVHGDTALNVAARVGNKALVNLLLDSGADKARANKLGLKPQDFGIEVQALWIAPGEAMVSNLKTEIPKPERQSRDVQRNISAIFETINDTFAAEMTVKQTVLNTTESSVRTATKALAEKRQQVVQAQSTIEELERVQQKIENLQRAMGITSLSAPEVWTGRSTIGFESEAPSAFRQLPPSVPQPVVNGGSDDVPIPQKGEEDLVLRLKRQSLWEDRMAQVLEDKIQALEGETADKAVKYRKLVSLCTKVPVDKVDTSLDILTTAIESDGQSIDLSRIAGFMNRIKETG